GSARTPHAAPGPSFARPVARRDLPTRRARSRGSGIGKEEEGARGDAPPQCTGLREQGSTTPAVPPVAAFRLVVAVAPAAAIPPVALLRPRLVIAAVAILVTARLLGALAGFGVAALVVAPLLPFVPRALVPVPRAVVPALAHLALPLVLLVPLPPLVSLLLLTLLLLTLLVPALLLPLEPLATAIVVPLSPVAALSSAALTRVVTPTRVISLTGTAGIPHVARTVPRRSAPGVACPSSAIARAA